MLAIIETCRYFIKSTEYSFVFQQTLYVVNCSIYFCSIDLQDGFLKTFLDEAKDLSYMECGKLLMESDGISITHKDVAQEGQTEV